MKKRVSRSLLNRLLARSEGLSTADKEDVLANVLAAHGARRAWWSLPSFRVAGLALATSVALALVWVQQRAPEDAFQARGGESKFSFEMACLNAGVAADCRDGRTVAFRVMTPTPAWFSALTLTNEGSALWYFSNVETTGGVLDRAPVLGPQPAGSVVVIGVFTPAPIEKAALRERLARGDPTMNVVRRTFTVVP